MEKREPDPLDAFAASRRLAWEPSAGFAARVQAEVASLPSHAPATAGADTRSRTAAATGSPRGATRTPHGPGRNRRPWAFARGLAAPRRSLQVTFASLAALLMAGGAFWLRTDTGLPPALQGAGATQVKGEEFSLAFLAGKGAQLAPVRPGDAFRAGDRLQPVYSSAREGYVTLLSIDAQGKVSGYSASGPRAALPPAQGRTLPFAIELDASRGDELFLAVRTREPLDANGAQAALKRAYEANGRTLEGLPARLDAAVFGTAADARLSTFRIGKQGDDL